MKINFVFSNQAQIDPGFEISQLKELGSFWGGWRTWRSCQTDNVVCYDFSKASELLNRKFEETCNFYISQSTYTKLGRPLGVKLYDGEFLHEVDNHDDIVSMHLASINADIVLLMGFDFSEQIQLQDKLAEHKAHNYRCLIRQVILDNPNVQWVVLDHQKEFRKDLQNLSNLGKDTLTNIIIK